MKARKREFLKTRILPFDAPLRFPGVERLEQKLIELEIGIGGALPEPLAESRRHFERQRLQIGGLGGRLCRPLRWRRRCRTGTGAGRAPAATASVMGAAASDVRAARSIAGRLLMLEFSLS